MLVVGRDMRDRREIERLVWHSLIIALVAASLLAVGGALAFRRLLEARIAARSLWRAARRALCGTADPQLAFLLDG